MRRTRQNADEPEPEPTFNMDQMTAFLQSLQQAASGSSRQSDRRKLLKEFKEQDPPSFDGKPDPVAAELWIESVEKKFDILDIPQRFRVEFATYMFEGAATQWWKMQLDDLGNRNPTWQEFENMFLNYYVPEDYRLGKVNDFFELSQGNMSVAEYQAKFVSLSRYAPEVVADPRARTAKFIRGLRPRLREALAPMLLTDFAAAAAAARNTETEIARNQGRHKESENRDRRMRRGRKHSGQGSQGSGTSSSSGSSGGGRFSPYGACHNCGQVGHFKRNCPQLQGQQQQSVGGFNQNRPMFQQSPAPSYASASQPRGPQQNFYYQQPRPQYSGFQPTQTVQIATPATSSRGSFQPQGSAGSNGSQHRRGRG